MRKFALACAAGAMILQPVAALAGTKDFAIQGYALPADKPVTIVLMRPDVSVGELQAGGLPQPNADWTTAARTNIEKALVAALAERKIAFSNMEESITKLKAAEAACAAAKATPQPATDPSQPPQPSPTTPITTPTGPGVLIDVIGQEANAGCALPKPGSAETEALVADYRGLHGAVVDAILAHKYNYGGGKLPTQKTNFDYTLGSGTKPLGQVAGANYGVFIMTVDQFSSSSRKAMQVMGALGCFIGACMIVSGGIHVAYVSLVDLDTGNVVWFNVLRGSQGDIREEQGANDMVKAILAGMPSRPGEMMAAPPKKKGG